MAFTGGMLSVLFADNDAGEKESYNMVDVLELIGFKNISDSEDIYTKGNIDDHFIGSTMPLFKIAEDNQIFLNNAACHKLSEENINVPGHDLKGTESSIKTFAMESLLWNIKNQKLTPQYSRDKNHIPALKLPAVYQVDMGEIAEDMGLNTDDYGYECNKKGQNIDWFFYDSGIKKLVESGMDFTKMGGFDGKKKLMKKIAEYETGTEAKDWLTQRHRVNTLLMMVKPFESESELDTWQDRYGKKIANNVISSIEL